VPVLLYFRLDAAGYFTPTPAAVRAKFRQNLRMVSGRWGEPDWEGKGECDPKAGRYRVSVPYRGQRHPYVCTLEHAPGRGPEVFEVRVDRAGRTFAPADRVACVLVREDGIRVDGAGQLDGEEEQLVGRLAADLASALRNAIP
jgi:hypothetical protein